MSGARPPKGVGETGAAPPPPPGPRRALASQGHGPSHTELPFVSVVMPVRDEASTIAGSLEALLAGTYPRDRMEVLVVDGQSRDGTATIVEARAERDARIRLLHNPAGSTAAGLNLGIRAARGEILVRLDGHTTPAPDYVAMAVATLVRTGAWCVGGHFIGRGTGAFGEAVALALSSPFGAGDARFRLGGQGAVDTVYLGAWPRWVFDTVGGFDEDLVRNQDYELCVRIRQAGGTVWLEPAIRSTTLVRSSPLALARQYFGYGAGRAATVMRHPRSLGARQLIPALFVATLVVGIAASPVARAARVALAALLVAYAVADLASSLLVARRAGWRHLPWLLLVYPILHLAWGSGFWLGVLHAWLRRKHSTRPWTGQLSA